MRRRRLGAAAALFCMLLPVAAAAQRLPDGKWWKRPRIAEAIGLTVDQSKALDDIFNKARPKLIDLRADVEKKNFAFDQAMEDPASSREEIAKLLEEREQARARLQKELGLMIVDTRRVLTDPQWTKLMQIREQFEANRKRRLESDRELPKPTPTPDEDDD
ncbi:MAG TPA: periplasmic heavy metal sensor [Thermoanaerobaculia bacterium]